MNQRFVGQIDVIFLRAVSSVEQPALKMIRTKSGLNSRTFPPFRVNAKSLMAVEFEALVLTCLHAFPEHCECLLYESSS